MFRSHYSLRFSEGIERLLRLLASRGRCWLSALAMTRGRRSYRNRLTVRSVPLSPCLSSWTTRLALKTCPKCGNKRGSAVQPLREGIRDLAFCGGCETAARRRRHCCHIWGKFSATGPFAVGPPPASAFARGLCAAGGRGWARECRDCLTGVTGLPLLWDNGGRENVTCMLG